MLYLIYKRVTLYGICLIQVSLSKSQNWRSGRSPRMLAGTGSNIQMRKLNGVGRVRTVACQTGSQHDEGGRRLVASGRSAGWQIVGLHNIFAQTNTLMGGKVFALNGGHFERFTDKIAQLLKAFSVTSVACRSVVHSNAVANSDRQTCVAGQSGDGEQVGIGQRQGTVFHL